MKDERGRDSLLIEVTPAIRRLAGIALTLSQTSVLNSIKGNQGARWA